jgi:hypothetical protein
VRTNELLIGACAALLALPVLASAAPSKPLRGLTRIAGTIERVDGREFLIRGPGGTTATYELAPSASITTSRRGTLNDLAAGKFVGCTAVKGRDGKLYATECHIFPESMRGVGEGHNPMGPPNTTMTNGDIATMTNGEVRTARGADGGTMLHITYKGGAQNIEVSAQTHIAVIEPGKAALLRPGAKVMGASRRAPDGTDVVQMLAIQP